MGWTSLQCCHCKIVVYWWLDTYSLPTGNSASFLIMDTTQGFEPYPRYPYAIKTDATATPF
jgi:hypothetical protein